MFLRIKKVNKKEYCYLVENVWKKRKGSRQKVKKYLGAVIKLSSEPKDFFDYYNAQDKYLFFDNKTRKQIVQELVLFEAAKAGFENKKNSLEKDSIAISKKTFKTTRKGKDVVLSINEGYLCSHTIKKIINFEKSDDIESDSFILARYFVDAGLNVPKEAFIAFYQAL